MWNIKLALLIALSICLALYLSIQHQFLFAQDNTTEIFTPNNNMNTGMSSNSTGIMKNTSGMIDDAFDVLKESFGTFFGGN